MSIFEEATDPATAEYISDIDILGITDNEAVNTELEESSEPKSLLDEFFENR